MDANRNGVVEVEEVHDFLQAMRGRQDAPLYDEEALQRCLISADKDGDGELDFYDFLRMYTKNAVFQTPALESVSSEPDDMTEANLIHAMNVGFTEKEAKELYELYMSLERDEDGGVKIEEVWRALSSSGQILLP